MSIDYRPFDFGREDPQSLFDLFTATYGSASPLTRRWKWQYVDHPRQAEIKIVVAEENGRIVGSTAHLPSDVMLQGAVHRCYYASDSMVHPDFRRRGLMEGIYQSCIELMPLMYAKGTNPGMLELRRKLGFLPVYPNNYMTSILAPFGWLMLKSGLHTRRRSLGFAKGMPNGEFRFVDRFGEEFDRFFSSIAPSYPGLVVRDADFMNWRYKGHPYKQYHTVCRYADDRLVSLAVVRLEAESAYLVDVLWDTKWADEPFQIVDFVREQSRRAGCVKLYCWGTFGPLRDNLRKVGFINRGDTPHLTVYGPSEIAGRLADGHNFHFVDGDGDNESL